MNLTPPAVDSSEELPVKKVPLIQEHVVGTNGKTTKASFCRLNISDGLVKMGRSETCAAANVHNNNNNVYTGTPNH